MTTLKQLTGFNHPLSFKTQERINSYLFVNDKYYLATYRQVKEYDFKGELTYQMGVFNLQSKEFINQLLQSYSCLTNLHRRSSLYYYLTTQVKRLRSNQETLKQGLEQDYQHLLGLTYFPRCFRFMDSALKEFTNNAVNVDTIKGQYPSGIIALSQVAKTATINFKLAK